MIRYFIVWGDAPSQFVVTHSPLHIGEEIDKGKDRYMVQSIKHQAVAGGERTLHPIVTMRRMS